MLRFHVIASRAARVHALFVVVASVDVIVDQVFQPVGHGLVLFKLSTFSETNLEN